MDGLDLSYQKIEKESVENRTIFDETYTFKKSDGKLITVQAIACHKKIGELYTGSIGKLEILNN